MEPSWLCCQLGAREHYAIPRALHQVGQLASLITDVWVPPQSVFNALPVPQLRNLRERFHPDLAFASVKAFTPSLLQFELTHQIQKTGGWERTIARNHWYQQQVVRQLAAIAPTISSGDRPTLFTYSYAALEILQYAKAQGWNTVLGQIDPGPIEEQIVLAEHQKHPALAPTWEPVPHSYWETWKKECELADRIVVNSSWSSQALQQTGIPKHKIKIIPLAYSSPRSAQHFQRAYPAAFSKTRPLRVLFLGQVILRKGVAALLEAAESLSDYPIEFWIVGPQGITKQQPIDRNKQIKWLGGVSRSLVATNYQQADVFLFPTLSDGFGLTQLEAQAWKLPLIVSRYCGEVVKDQVNGLILPEVTSAAIANALLFCLNHPQMLEAFSRQSISLEYFSLSQLQERLQPLSYAIV